MSERSATAFHSIQQSCWKLTRLNPFRKPLSPLSTTIPLLDLDSMYRDKVFCLPNTKCANARLFWIWRGNPVRRWIQCKSSWIGYAPDFREKQILQMAERTWLVIFNTGFTSMFLPTVTVASSGRLLCKWPPIHRVWRDTPLRVEHRDGDYREIRRSSWNKQCHAAEHFGIWWRCSWYCCKFSDESDNDYLSSFHPRRGPGSKRPSKYWRTAEIGSLWKECYKILQLKFQP